MEKRDYEVDVDSVDVGIDIKLDRLLKVNRRVKEARFKNKAAKKK